MMTYALLRQGRFLCLVLVTVLFLSVSAPSDEATRWWTWNGFMTEAAFVSTSDDGSTVKLRKVSGKEVDVAVDRLSDEDKRYLQENHLVSSAPPAPPTEESPAPSSGEDEDEGDYFTFYGERLKKSEEISGIRLGDLAKNYVTGKWVREYEIKKKGEDLVMLIPKNETSPIGFIGIVLDVSSQRVYELSVYMKDNTEANLRAIKDRFSTKYEYQRVDSDGHSWYRTRNKPELSISVGYTDSNNILVFYMHNKMYELGKNNKDSTRKETIDQLNL